MCTSLNNYVHLSNIRSLCVDIFYPSCVYQKNSFPFSKHMISFRKQLKEHLFRICFELRCSGSFCYHIINMFFNQFKSILIL